MTDDHKYGIIGYIELQEGVTQVMLNEEQEKLVEENHKLIYWYIKIRHLDIEEWYDLLAIELCHTIMKYDSEKGSISNYFKLRADGLVSKEYKKSQSQKRANETISYIENVHYVVHDTQMTEELELKEWMEINNKDILNLKSQGYTQSEIANQLNVSQSYISKILKKARKDYYDFDKP